jgi:hypothetical protein
MGTKSVERGTRRLGFSASWRRGQVAVVLTLAIVTLVGAMALGADVAVFYFNWVELQKAADAAVVAGATFLPSNPSLAISTANDYVQRNGVKQAEIVSTTVSSDQREIQMKLTRTVPYYFARVLGLSAGLVDVKATGGIQASKTAAGLVPIGIQYGTDMTTFQSVTLKLAPAQGMVGPGNWEPLAMGYTPNSDPGGKNYQTNIEYGYQPTLTINDLIYTEPGNLVGPTQQGINFRLSGGSTSDPSGTASDHTLSDPRTIEIPIVNFNNVNGSSQVQIMGFAELWIISVAGNGNITAEFINQVGIDNAGDPNAPQYGAFTPVLLN